MDAIYLHCKATAFKTINKNENNNERKKQPYRSSRGWLSVNNN